MNNGTPQPTVKDSLTVQKPRCPWPVHQWAPQVKSVRVHDQTRLIVYLTTSPFPSNFDFDCSGLRTDTTWTRAEALESQILPAPDRAGVWLIDCSGVSGAPLQSDVFGSVEIHKDYEMKGFVRSVYGMSWSVEMGIRFYYMGPLPTAEGEVCHG